MNKPAGRHVYTFTRDDMGKPWIKFEGQVYLLQNFFGPVFERDVGKRVYAVPTDDGTSEVLQVESDRQFELRTMCERAKRADETQDWIEKRTKNTNNKHED